MQSCVLVFRFLILHHLLLIQTQLQVITLFIRLFFSKRVVSLLLLALVSGCVSIPHVLISKPGYKNDDCDDLCKLNVSLDYADRLDTAYDSRVFDNSKRKLRVGQALIVLGAASLGLVYGDVHNDVLVGTALLGTTGYQLSTWGDNKSRDAIFRKGQEKLSCSRNVVKPLAVSRTIYKQIDANVKRLEDQMILANASMAKLRVLVQIQEAGAQVATATVILTRGENAMTRARQSSVNSYQLKLNRDAAANALRNAVDEIGIAINRLLDGTIADLESINTVISQMQNFRNFAGIGEFIDARALADLAEKKNNNFINGNEDSANFHTDLITAIEKADKDVRQLEIEIDRVAASLNIQFDETDQNKCKLDASALVSPLQLSPNSVSMPASRTEEWIEVKGGTLPYRARVTSSPASVDVHIPNGSTEIQIKRTDDATGVFFVRVRDASNQSTLLKVTMEADRKLKKSKNDNQRVDLGQARGQCPSKGTSGLTKKEVCLIQQLVGTKDDGVFGDDTCKAVENGFNTVLGISPSKAFTIDFTAQLILKEAKKKRNDISPEEIESTVVCSS